MPLNDMTFIIGGEAGQGVESSGAGFAKALARGELHVFGLPDYRSRIRGGHNFFQIRVGTRPLYSHGGPAHLLLALTEEAVLRHREDIPAGGGVLYDPELAVDAGWMKDKGILACPVPLGKIVKGAGGTRAMVNTAALGAATGLTGYDFSKVAGVIEDNFRRKGQDVVDLNLKIAQAALDYVRTTFASSFDYRLEPVSGPPRMVVNGNQAFCLGALAAGCKFVAAYPMTPSTTIIEFMSARAAQYGLVTKHTEDEIAAICMAIGAGHAGVRAMASTSGGGFSLMVEALGSGGDDRDPRGHRGGTAAGPLHRAGHAHRAGGPVISPARFPGGIPPHRPGSRHGGAML